MLDELIEDVARAIASTPLVEDLVRGEWLAAALDPTAFERSGKPAHFTASALPVTPDGERVCLVLHGRIGLWVQPGGHLEPLDRSVADAAARELAEEAGVAGTIDPEPVDLSRHPAPCGTADWHLDLQMLAVVEEVEVTVSAESVDVAWFDVDRLPDPMAPGVDELVDRAVGRVRRSGPRAPMSPRP